MNTYSDYLDCELSLSLEEMIRIHKEMTESIGTDETALELYQDLLAQATKYADYRANWALWTIEKRLEMDSSRSKCHNRLIDCFNILARYLEKSDKNINWRKNLGYIEDNPLNRKTIGDFACFIVFINAINAR